MPIEKRTYCRMCSGKCGMVAEVDNDGRLLGVRGDHEHALTQGYACFKGLQSAAIHNSPERLLHSLKRTPDGRFVRVPLEQALDEIAARLADVIGRNGARSVALFRGTPNYANSAASYMIRYFMKAIGSPCFFSTMTIDQSAKWVTDDRLGTWRAGRHRIETADVFMAFGYNPLLSIQGTYGFNVNNPAKRMREAKARGLKLIVVDPRRTETARFADIHLQPLPGEDAAIAAGMLREILQQGWEDKAFCARWAPGLADLRAAVEAFTPEYVAERAGIPAALFRDAVALFARDSRRGIAMTGTGPDMASHSNLANHLVECLNVVCGRFNREGERVANTGVLEPLRRLRAEARSPTRSWERGAKGRVRGFGRLNGEMMSATLPEEILAPGEGQIRALFSVAGNPASVFPDQRRTAEALTGLDLLVALDSAMTNTAKLAHYIIPPRLMFERPDAPVIWETVAYPVPFAQYTPAVCRPPAGSEVVDEWYPFWALAKRLGKAIVFCGEPLDMAVPPDTEHLLDLITKHSQLPLAEVRKHPGGVLFRSEPQFVAPADPDRAGAFDVAPADVRAELAEVRGEWPDGAAAATPARFTHRLAVRRMRDVMNSSYRAIPAIHSRVPYNPASLHPADLAALGLAEGEEVEIESAHGRIPAIVKADETVRRGVVTVSHGFGGLPWEALPYRQAGANTNLLTSIDQHAQTINAMPRFSAVPVAIRAKRPPAIPLDGRLL